MVEARRIYPEDLARPQDGFERTSRTLTEAERQDITEISQDLKALLTDWHLSPNKRIPDALYKQDDPIAKAHFEHLGKNMMRKVWFTNVLLNIEFTERALTGKGIQDMVNLLSARRKDMRERVHKATTTTIELVEEMKALAELALATIKTVLSPEVLSSPRTAKREVPARSRHMPPGEAQQEATL